MNFSDKSLVVSGCSFSSGGGLDNPDFWETLFPNINKNDYLDVAGYPTEEFYHQIVDKNNYVYFLSKAGKFKEYFNLSEGGAGIYSTLQRLFRFIKENKDKNMFIIYQPPAYNRIEGVVNGNFKSFWGLKDSDEKLFDKYYKNFYDDIFHFYKSILEIDKLNELCKAKDIKFFLLDWNGVYDIESQYFKQKCVEYKQNRNTIYTDHVGWFSHKYEMWSYNFRKIVSDWKVINIKDFWQTNELDCKIKIDGKIVDHHLSPNGAKKLGKFLYEKINPKINLI